MSRSQLPHRSPGSVAIDRVPAVRRLQSGFSQILTFLSLIEIGDLDEVAHLRGLGRSTVGFHLRQMAADYGDDLLQRIGTGLVPTRAGIAAYRLLRPLMIGITDAFAALQEPVDAAPFDPLALLMPEGLPGCVLARAAEQALSAWPDLPDHPRSTSRAAPGLTIAFCVLGTGELAADRWAVVGLPGAAGWVNGALPWDVLRGLVVQLPRLPSDLAQVVRDRLADAGARAVGGERDALELLQDLGGGGGSPAVLVPASLLNRAMVARQLYGGLMESGAIDPGLIIEGGSAGSCAEATLELLGRKLAAAIAPSSPANAPSRSLPEMDQLTIRHCLAFCALYEERNIRRASERLCIVQPALTVQLRRIETRIGRSLFDRSSRGIKPNGAAELLYARLHPALMRLLQSPQTLSRADHHAAARRLRLGLMPLVDENSSIAISVARALDEHARNHPGQNVAVTEAFSAELVRSLREKRVDLILVDQPFDDAELVFEMVATDSLAVIVDSASDLLPPGPVDLDRLRTLPLIMPSAQNGLRSLLIEQMRQHGWIFQPQIEIDSIATILSLLKTMRYATILPVGAVHLSRGRREISVHEIRSPRLCRQICVGRRRWEPGNDVGRTLIDALRAAFATFAPN